MLLELCLLLTAFVGVFGEASLFQRYFVENAQERKALCNDLTPAGYYVRNGSSNNWVIRLQGGGWCYDVPSCKGRMQASPYLMTSKVLPPQMNDTVKIGPAAHGGILSSDQSINPYFYNANHVYIWYCSSDSHLGTKDPSPETNNWAFYGKHIIQGIIEDLIQMQEPRITLAENILITGDSAGGVGAINNIDFIVQLLKPHVAKTTKFGGYIDAGWFLDIPTFKNSTTSFQEISKHLLSNFNVIYDETCMNQLKDQSWKCFHTQYLHPYITTPLIYHEFLFDGANLGFDGIYPPYTPEMMVFINNMGSTMLSLLSAMPNVFAPSCNLHEVEDTNLFSALIVDGKHFGTQVLGEWYFQNTNSHYIDSCTTLNCNPQC